MTRQIYQKHHITYDPERMVWITKGEHSIVSRLQWLKSISQGAIEAIEYELHRLSNLPERVIPTEEEIRAEQKTHRNKQQRKRYARRKNQLSP